MHVKNLPVSVKY